MSSWFSKTAKNVFKPSTSEIPQPFVIACPQCSTPQQGLRQPFSQQVTCNVCSNVIFVLPRDVYPAAHALPKVPDHQPAPVTLLEDEVIAIIQDEESAEEASVTEHLPRRRKPTAEVDEEALPTLAQLRQRIRDAEKPRQTRVTAAMSRKQSSLEELGTTIGELGRDAQQEFVRFWTPFRILSLAVGLVILVTAGWTWRQSVLARAVRVAKQEGELGLAAVEQKDWTRARDHLQLAAAALDRLGRTDPESQTVRQYARETQARFRLCDVSLEELLSKAEEELVARGKGGKAGDQLARIYRGDWMLFEGTVRDIADKDSRHREYQIRLPVGPGGKPGETWVCVNFPVIRKLIEPGGEKALIVAGAISDVQYNSSGQWVITLEPDTGFLWTHLDTYEATGLEFHPLRTRAAVESQLVEQAQAMEVP